MTAIVGVWCRDGVVIGADSSMTFSVARGVNTIEQPTEKISIFGGAVIVAGSGSVGLNQRFCRIVGEHWDRVRFKGHHIDVGKALAAAMIDDFVSTKVERHQYSALVAFPCEKQHHLCEFALEDLQPEFKDSRAWYGSIGGGQTITDTFLGFIRHVFWSGGPPTVQDATFAVTWTLDHAIDVNAGGINGPVRIAVLEKSDGKVQARMLDDTELAEHRQNIEAAKERLRTFRAEHAPGLFVPEPPQA
jgi:hypothetical protein